MPERSKFTKHEIETAIGVMMRSRIVVDWVKGEARFLNVDLDTPAGKTFFEREKRAMAERLIK